MAGGKHQAGGGQASGKIGGRAQLDGSIFDCAGIAWRPENLIANAVVQGQAGGRLEGVLGKKRTLFISILPAEVRDAKAGQRLASERYREESGSIQNEVDDVAEGVESVATGR